MRLRILYSLQFKYHPNVEPSTPASSETSTDCLSSVLHALTDYNSTLIENSLFRHELVVLKENALLSWQ
jgi:hypothetical protein